MKRIFLCLLAVFLIFSCAKPKVVSTSPKEITPAEKEEPKKEIAPKVEEMDVTKKLNPEEVSPQMIAKAQMTNDNIEKENSVLAKMIHFDFDKYELKKEAKDVLNEIAEYLRAHPTVRIIIEGHCDERGTREYNLALGMKRAEVAKKYLVDLGIDAKRIEITSFGEDKPLVNEHNEEAWAKNRRDEFKKIK